MWSAIGILSWTGIRLDCILSRAEGPPYDPSREGESPSRPRGLPAADACCTADPLLMDAFCIEDPAYDSIEVSGTVIPDESNIIGLLLPLVPVIRCSCLHLAESARKSAIMACVRPLVASLIGAVCGAYRSEIPVALDPVTLDTLGDDKHVPQSAGRCHHCLHHCRQCPCQAARSHRCLDTVGCPRI